MVKEVEELTRRGNYEWSYWKIYLCGC
jgi:hypothetical protein